MSKGNQTYRNLYRPLSYVLAGASDDLNQYSDLKFSKEELAKSLSFTELFDKVKSKLDSLYQTVSEITDESTPNIQAILVRTNELLSALGELQSYLTGQLPK